MNRNKIKRIILRCAAVLVCAVMLGALCCACSKSESSGVKTVNGVEARNAITNHADDIKIHYSKSKTAFTQKVASSGFIELHIDPETNTFGVFDTSLDQLWSVLPVLDEISQGQGLNDESSMASVVIAGGTDLYHLNTQDNSVYYGKASYTTKENGAEFLFDIFPDKKTAEKTSYSKTDIGFRIIITATLADGSMNVDCAYKNITGNPDAFIESITLLESFGCYSKSANDDFLLVPDGSGAIIKTSVFDESFESLEFSVYGADASISNEAENTAIIPAFGIKHGEGAFVALIEEGDAVAKICADKAKTLSEYNKVYSSYTVTPVIYEDETITVSNTAATDSISLCYRFLTRNNATYSGLASACREQLIRNGVLSTGTVTESGYLPFFLTVNGAVTKKLGPVNYTSAATTFEQAVDMLSIMKSKGINNINLRYTGVFAGGVNSSDISGASVIRRLGGENGLEELNSYISTQKMSLFLDINLLTSATGFSGGKALDIRKEHGSFIPEFADDYMNTIIRSRNCRSLDNLKNIVNDVLAKTKNYAFSGFCLNDVGSMLYSDFSNGGQLRQKAAETINNSIRPLSTSKNTMAVKGNFYMLKNIDCIINLPIKATAASSGSYISVPFVQLVLHGIVDYSGEPMNTDSNIKESMLKSIEYGACPHFAWRYEPAGNAETDSFYYVNTINYAAEFYTEANTVLYDLRSSRITDHYKVQDGVFCTEYDTGSMVYVNYTDSDCSVNGIVVEAQSWFRVN